MMDIGLFLDLLNINSTSSQEGQLADFLVNRLGDEGCEVSRVPSCTPRGEPVNLLFSWGDPQIVFCTHLDTVPPYIVPTVEMSADGDTIIRGRGACDAKGQIFAMYSACSELARQGETGFGLLLLYGEETGSFGAKEYRRYPGGEYVVVGEPTDCCMVSASKGTKAFELTFHGRSFHSGYPEYGDSAVEHFVAFMNSLKSTHLPTDPELGNTTYNIGKLISDNPQNTLSDRLACRIYFRSTFITDTLIEPLIKDLAKLHNADAKALGGDTPMRYLTLPGFETKTVAFGSDAPQLTNFKHKMLCGPGSILVAHRDEEYIRLSDLKKAESIYIEIFNRLKTSK